MGPGGVLLRSGCSAAGTRRLSRAQPPR
jgi:hypothetical protein